MEKFFKKKPGKAAERAKCSSSKRRSQQISTKTEKSINSSICMLYGGDQTGKIIGSSCLWKMKVGVIWAEDCYFW